MMNKARKLLLEAALIPAGITIRTKEDSATVVICSVDFPAKSRKVNTDFTANKPG
jgi:hypothetical protein